MKKNTKKGFTLVELLVVIAILAILATVSVVGYTAFINRANQSNAQTEADQIEAYISSYLVIDGDSIQLGENAYIVKSGGKLYLSKTANLAASPTKANITITNTDLKTCTGKLSLSGTKLQYTAYGVTVDVHTDITEYTAS